MTIQECIDKWKRELPHAHQHNPHMMVFQFIKDLEEIHVDIPGPVEFSGKWKFESGPLVNVVPPKQDKQ